MIHVVAYKAIVDGDLVATFIRYIPMDSPPAEGLTIIDNDGTEIVAIDVAYSRRHQAYLVYGGEIDASDEDWTLLEILDEFAGWTLLDVQTTE